MTTFSGFQVSTSSSPTGPFIRSKANAGIDSAQRGLKPADFAIEEVGEWYSVRLVEKQAKTSVEGKGYAAYSVLPKSDLSGLQLTS